MSPFWALNFEYRRGVAYLDQEENSQAPVSFEVGRLDFLLYFTFLTCFGRFLQLCHRIVWVVISLNIFMKGLSERRPFSTIQFPLTVTEEMPSQASSYRRLPIQDKYFLSFCLRFTARPFMTQYQQDNKAWLLESPVCASIFFSR